jgi:hypothetical protein
MRMEQLTDTIIIRGVSIPRLGFGTFRMPGGGCQPVAESPPALGYRPSRDCLAARDAMIAIPKAQWPESHQLNLDG